MRRIFGFNFKIIFMHPLVYLAKQAVETFIKEEKIILPSDDLPKKFLERRAGTFVTIKKSGDLRGCIGTYLATRKNIAEEIIYNAIAAATQDYRFKPVKKEELPYFSYFVYILSQPELIKDINELNPKKFGIIVKTVPIVSADKIDIISDSPFPSKSGLLLPDLEGVNTVEHQIAIACQKAGIDLTQEKILIYRFTVEKYGND